MSKIKRPPKQRLYSEDDQRFILKNAATMTVEEIAAKLNRTPKAIAGKANQMGVKCKSDGSFYGN